MPKTRQPRKGSLQYWPRKKAKKHTARVRSFAKPEAGIGGFAGYKVGTINAYYVDSRKGSPTSKEILVKVATLIECPPLKIASVRFYKQTPYGRKVATEVLNPKLDKELARKISISKKKKELPSDVSRFSDIRLIVYTQPKLTIIGKKKPELFEVAVAGSVEDQLKFAKENLDKEIKVQDVFKEGQQMDVHAVTKGKGFQGPVKRFGIGLKSHKSEKSRRFAVLAAEGDAKVKYTAHQPGQHGYHLRTEYNKWLLKIVDDVKTFAHFKHYGEVKNSCMLVKGTVPGARKRLITFTTPIRPTKKIPTQAPEIKQIK